MLSQTKKLKLTQLSQHIVSDNVNTPVTLNSESLINDWLWSSTVVSISSVTVTGIKENKQCGGTQNYWETSSLVSMWHCSYPFSHSSLPYFVDICTCNHTHARNINNI